MQIVELFRATFTRLVKKDENDKMSCKYPSLSENMAIRPPKQKENKGAIACFSAEINNFS